MEYMFYPLIEEETKKKIAAIVNAGYGFVAMNYAANFMRSRNKELFKAAVDKYFQKVCTNKLPEAAQDTEALIDNEYVG